MRKLLLIGPGYVHTYRFAALVQPLFDDILVVTEKPDPAQAFKTVTVNFALRRPLNHLHTVARIRAAIAAFQPDIIHLHQANSVAYFGLRAAAGKNIPTVLTAWGSDVLLLPERGWLMRSMVAWNLRKADALTADARFMARRMAALSGRDETGILVANFGIDLPGNPVPKENIIYSNRLHKPLYRIQDIIRAFAKFHATPRGSTWRLVIGGSGPGTAALEREVIGLGLQDAVQFTGWVDAQQNADWYARSRLYVSIPLSDGTSISLLEAMSHGCLPVVSDLPANREWVTHGENGFLVKDVGKDFFTDALQMDMANASRINRNRIAAEASREVSRNRFSALYDSLTTGSVRVRQSSPS